MKVCREHVLALRKGMTYQIVKKVNARFVNY